MIKTKSIHDTPEASDGKRIVITHYWPRGYSKEKLDVTWDRPWRHELAPSTSRRKGRSPMRDLKPTD